MYGKMGLVFLSASAVAVLVFLADNSHILPQDESGTSIVKRNSPGGGAREEELVVQIGEEEETIKFAVEEQEYTEAELEQVFADAEETLEMLVLGENESLDEVRSDLNLVTEIPGTGVRVSWEPDNYEVINMQGEIQSENLTDSGTLIRLDALLTYGEEKIQYTFFAHVYPPKVSQMEKLLQKVKDEISRLDEENRESEDLPLPDNVDGVSITWGYVRNFRAAGLVLLGIALSAYVYASEQQKQKEEKKKRELQLMLDYPQMVNKFTLFLGAGMTARRAWCQVAEDYEKQKQENGKREVYEEMLYTMHEMKGGTSEGLCYERFGEHCGLPVYRKFGVLLSQNLKKGTKGLAVLLKQEADNAFEERKSLAKRLGEEAGTKLLIPMFLMLAVVLVMVVVPAFFSMQI